MTQAAPIRIRYRSGRSQAVNRRFLSWFWAFAVTFAVAAFYRPAITAFTVCFPVLLVLWVRELRRAPRPGWILEVAGSHLALEGGRPKTVAREKAAEVRFRRRGLPRPSWTELMVLGDSGRTLFRTAVDEPDRARVAEALRQTGWPLA